MTTISPHEQRLRSMAASQLPVDADRDLAAWVLPQLDELKRLRALVSESAAAVGRHAKDLAELRERMAEGARPSASHEETPVGYHD